MDYSLVNSKIGAEHQILFLNRDKIVGLQSIEASQNFAAAPLSYAGIGSKTLNFIPRGEQNNTLNINCYLINSDPFISLVTGNSLSNLYLLREQNDLINNYIFHSGYFNQYNSTYNIGNVPQISVTCISNKDAGKIPTGELSLDAQNDLAFISTGDYTITGLLIPSPGSITLNLDTFQSNRVQSYSINVNSNKIPKYKMGQKHPQSVELLSNNIECSFSFELGSYEIQKLRNFPKSGIVKNLSITVKDYNSENIIANYSFNNLNLVTEDYQNSANENVIVNQKYQTKLW